MTERLSSPSSLQQVPTDKLQRVLNVAARVTSGTGKHDRGLSVNLHLRDGQTDCPSVSPSLRWSLKRTDGRTDAGNRIWSILALTCDIWWK